MSLYERLREGQAVEDRTDHLDGLRQRIHQRVIAELGPLFYDNTVDPAQLHPQVQQLLQMALREEQTPLSASDKVQLVEDVLDDILGHGPIEKYL